METVEDPPFYLQPATLDLIAEQGVLIDVIRKRIGSNPPTVVVLDTLNRSLRGSESSDEVMGAYLATKHLISLKHHRIALIKATPSLSRRS